MSFCVLLTRGKLLFGLALIPILFLTAITNFSMLRSEKDSYEIFSNLPRADVVEM